MAEMKQGGLTEEQIKFCTYFETNLYNKTTATFDKIQAAANLLGRNVDTSCPTCARNAWLELLNTFNGLLDAWNVYKNPPAPEPIKKTAVTKSKKVIEDEFFNLGDEGNLLK